MSGHYRSESVKATAQKPHGLYAQHHPFALPPEIQVQAESVLRRLECRVMDNPYLMFPTSESGEPQALGAFQHSLFNLEVVLTALDRMRREVVNQGEASEEAFADLQTIQMAFEHEIRQQEALIDWMRLTWRYDPAIQSAAGEAPGIPLEESAVSGEAPQSEETDETLPYPRFLDALNEWTDKHRGLIRALQMMNGEIDHNSKFAIWSMAEVLDGQTDDLEELWKAQRPTRSSDREGHRTCAKA
jgi:hypothetical protein